MSVAANNTGIETGTNAGNTFPCMTKRDVDITAAFGADGTPLMNRLYILGLTTSSSSVGYSDATTPCYIYEPEGIYYKLMATIENMNVDSKSPYFKVSANNQKIYFTGYCPFATTGRTHEENAVFHVVDGAKDANIDIYLDNLQIYARSKNNAKHYLTEEYDDKGNFVINNFSTALVSDGGSFDGYPVGTGSVFAFSSVETDDNSYFQPKIHVQSDNILDATNGLTLEMRVITKDNFSQTTIGNQSSSPIQILPTPTINGKNQRTKLKIDDIWPNNMRTNGKLALQEKSGGIEGNYKETTNIAPMIDFGNQHTILSIAGGHMFIGTNH